MTATFPRNSGIDEYINFLLTKKKQERCKILISM